TLAAHRAGVEQPLAVGPADRPVIASHEQRGHPERAPVERRVVGRAQAEIAELVVAEDAHGIAQRIRVAGRDRIPEDLDLPVIDGRWPGGVEAPLAVRPALLVLDGLLHDRDASLRIALRGAGLVKVADLLAADLELVEVAAAV